MSITSGFKGKAAKKAIRLLDNKYNRLESAIAAVEFEGRDKLTAQLKKQYSKEYLELTSKIVEGKIKEEDAAPAKKKVPAKKVAKKATGKKKTKLAVADEDTDFVVA